MRNLIKKILQETTGDEVTSFEKMRSLTSKVAKFLSRLEVDDSVCKYMLTPFVLGGGSINIMVLTTNPYQKESVINDIRLKVKTAFKGYKIDAYSFPNYDNRGCEEFEEDFNNYLQNYPESNAVFVSPKHKKTNLDESSKLNENDKIDQIIKKGIRKVIDKEITSWGYNKDKTTVFLFDKNDKCLIDYNTKNRKLWYDHHLLDVVGRKIKTEGFLGQQFKEVLRDWFESNFEKYGYKVDPNKKVEGANIHLY
jgi:hypothetical protein